MSTSITGSVSTLQTVVTFSGVQVRAVLQLYRDATGPVVIAAQLGQIEGFVPWDDLSDVERVRILEAPGVKKEG
jgi:hypothetical protein